MQVCKIPRNDIAIGICIRLDSQFYISVLRMLAECAKIEEVGCYVQTAGLDSVVAFCNIQVRNYPAFNTTAYRLVVLLSMHA